MIKIKGNYIFKCTYDKDSLEEMDIIKSSTQNIENAYLKSDKMADASRILKKYKNDCVCTLPLCNTVEAQSLGANIVIDEISTPRAKDYKYKTIDELMEIKNLDLSSSLVNEVLKAVSKLSDEGEDIVLNIEGPITILTSLIDLTKVIKAIRKEKDKLDDILEFIKDFIIDYGVEGVKSGAKIISYADPTGNMDILGERTYSKLNSKITLKIINELKDKVGDRALIHVCGRTTSSLLNLGLIEINEIGFCEDALYGEALLKLPSKGVNLVGQNCIKKTKKNVDSEKIYEVKILK